jgi:3-hydroxyacyl-[acyl-carrier-protein] dehydratase
MSALRAALCFAADHPALAGHFPARPIVPGVLLLDAALQAVEQATADAAASHWHIASAKFHRPVRPGESLQLDCQPQPGGLLRVEIRAADALVLSALIERKTA